MSLSWAADPGSKGPFVLSWGISPPSTFQAQEGERHADHPLVRPSGSCPSQGAGGMRRGHPGEPLAPRSPGTGEPRALDQRIRGVPARRRTARRARQWDTSSSCVIGLPAAGLTTPPLARSSSRRAPPTTATSATLGGRPTRSRRTWCASTAAAAPRGVTARGWCRAPGRAPNCTSSGPGIRGSSKLAGTLSRSGDVG